MLADRIKCGIIRANRADWEHSVADNSVIQKMVWRIRVFVASPGDVEDERRGVPSVIARVNERQALRQGILLDPWLWEMDAVPGIGRVQEQINPNLDEAAVVILVLWNRLGTPSGKAQSGTVEEFERAVERYGRTGWPRVLVYYCNRASTLETEDQLAQRELVLQFKKDHSKDVLAASFDTLEDFDEQLETHLGAVVDDIAAVPLTGQAPQSYRKLLYVKVTCLRQKKAGATAFYQRTVDRLPADDRMVQVYDEAVYYTLEMFSEKKKPGPRTERTQGVVDPRMVIPLKNPLVFSDEDAGLIPQTVQMEVNEECDTLLTVSHFENGMQGKDQYFATRISEDAQQARIIVDFSSVPDAKRFVIPGAAYLVTSAGEVDAKIEPFGESMYMASCENAKEGDLLKMTFTFDWMKLEQN